MRKPILDLVALGTLPSEKTVTVDQLEKIEALVVAIEKPLSDEEAEALVPVLGDDKCYGIALSIAQLIETAPGWPIAKSLTRTDNTWVATLIERSRKAELK